MNPHVEADDDYLRELTDTAADVEAPDTSPISGRVLLATPVRRLSLRPAVHLCPSSSVRVAVRAMTDEHVGAVMVVSGDTLKGIFTERDVVTRVAGAGRRPEELRLGDVMTPDPVSLDPDAPVAAAIHAMSVGGFRHIPVLGAGGLPTHLVNSQALADFVVDHYPEVVLNLPPDAGRDRRPRDRWGG